MVLSHADAKFGDSLYGGSNYLCNVDPAFFLRHLDLVHSSTERGYFTSPSLPSSNANILGLRIPTIGYRQFDKDITQKEIEELRWVASARMKEYRDNLERERNIETGDSIVRSFVVYDQEYYSIEQDLSISVNMLGKGWIEIALKTAHIASKPGIGAGRFPQSGSLIHTHYGRFLDLNTSMSDLFYSLGELFSFFANSETQFLNMTGQKIAMEMHKLIDDKNQLTAEEGIHDLTLSNLLYNLSIIDRHIARLKDCVSILKTNGGSRRPKASDDKQKAKALSTRVTLLEDFQYPLDKAINLSQTCERGMGIAGNNKIVAESRTAIGQVKRMSKLTLLASFFVPASFTTSLFGMNFQQFGSGSLNIWFRFMLILRGLPQML
ncbi:hypothetical protein P154DRAFT_529203 [Amniculicola lignicola CBS 123094]|uniref:Uncharacterized protein n=1 Tax=Amniculicola lignicola CBS 123094 TaxID=1392246 RepID=A0A6A5X415_9PLEO|nr:hypothetical protein P154DRAFT_529203 [Amniculicola lignicola CBS 123094]